MGLRQQYGAFNTALRSLYSDDILQLAHKEKPFVFDDSLFEAAASLVYENGGFDISQLEDPAARAVINETLRVLSTAIDSGLPHEVPPAVRYALENNAFIFSGFKTFHSMREIGLSMVTDKGEIKPFNDFMTDVKKINQMYNHNYLYAEYNHTVGTSLMAAKWHDFEQDGDRYDLQYRTAGDGKVREEHALLHETTLPASDPFWDKYFPPNGWNCRCTVLQVRKGKYPTSDPAMAMLRGDNCTDGVKQQMFRYNPGKTMELFPPKHPYYKTPTDAKKEINKLAVIEGRKRAVGNMPLKEKKVICDNILSGKLNQGNKARHRFLYHCYTPEELEAAVYFWNNPQVLGSPRISILGENKDMTNPKAQKNIENKKKRGICEYIEYRTTYKGVNWLIKTERHKKGFEQFYCIKREN